MGENLTWLPTWQRVLFVARGVLWRASLLGKKPLIRNEAHKELRLEAYLFVLFLSSCLSYQPLP